MNSFRSVASKSRSTLSKLRDPIKRTQFSHEMRRRMISFQGFKKFVLFSCLIYAFLMVKKIKGNFYGTMSRFTGKFANIKMPQLLIFPMLKLYCLYYKVNVEEMRGNGISDYNSFNSFFTRKLKDGWRNIEWKDDPTSIWSPCDGTVFNFGDCENDTMVVVKGTPYKLDEFLFGKSGDSQKYFAEILEKIQERGNDLKFMLLYLSPGDYHRFHSPAIHSTNYRRHIAGNLLSVAPSYVLRHPEVFVKNERVSWFGEWINGFFSTTFIGATNVGSIVLNYDKDLHTNRPGVAHNEIFDKNYLETSEFEGVFKNKLVIKKKSQTNLEEEETDISSDLGIFDVKDIINIEKGDNKLIYNEKEELQFRFNTFNEDSSTDESDTTPVFKFDSYQQELKDKLVEPEKLIQKYSLTNKGIMLGKGEEVGYFNLGSSIMLIFEAPKGSQFHVEVGQKVKLGNTIVTTNANDLANHN